MMKRTWLRPLLLLSLLLIAALLFTACSFGGSGDKDDNKGGSETDNGTNNGTNNGTGTTAASGIAADYNVEQIAQRLDGLRTSNGLYVKLHVTSTEENGTVDNYDLIYAANANLYYVVTEEGEYYFDCGDTTFTTYRKIADGVFTKTVMTYTEAYTKAQAEAGMSGQMAGLLGFFGIYQEFGNVPGMTTVKSTATVAGRSCDKYTMSAAAMGAAATIEICIDRTTGMCLKLSGTAITAEDGSGSATFECTEFRTPYTVTLPTVDAAHTTVDGRPQSDDNTGAGTGEGGSGTGTGEDGGNTGTVTLVSFAGEGIGANATFMTLTDPQNGGFAITYNIQQTNPAIVVFAAKDGVYSFMKMYNGNVEQKYMDLSDPTKAVMYEYNQSTQKWNVREIAYTGSTTKAAMLDQVRNEFITVACMNSRHTATDLVKTADVAPQRVVRTADLYTVSGGTETFLIDRQTGVCLEWSDGTNAYVCGAIQFGIDAISLPDVGGSQGGQGNEGGDPGTGTGETGEDPGTGTGEDPGTGTEPGGDPGTDPGLENRTLATDYPVATVESQFSKFFANGIFMQYTYKVKDPYSYDTNAGYVDCTVTCAVKGDVGFVKNDLTGYNAYYMFGTGSYTVYPYNASKGDYERIGYTYPYVTEEYGADGTVSQVTYTRTEIIMREIFGQNVGWDSYTVGATYSQRTDWANTQDYWNSLLVRYGRRGVNNCAFTKTTTTMVIDGVTRTVDRYAFAENMTEDNELTNGRYIVIDKETGVCLVWYREENTRFTADVFKTQDVTLELFTHYGFNPGDENDSTTIIHDYPHITDGTSVDALYARGFAITTKLIGRNASPTSTGHTYSFTVDNTGYRFYFEQDGVEAYIDATVETYYDHYLKGENGTWTATRKYYATDDEYSSRTALLSEMHGLLDRYMVLDEALARKSGMTKTDEVYAGRQANKYTITESQYYNYVICVDKETGIVLQKLVIVDSNGRQYTYEVCVEVLAFTSKAAITLPDVTVTDPGQGGQGSEGGDPGTGNDNPPADLVSFAGEGIDADAMFAAMTDPTGDGIMVTYVDRATGSNVMFAAKGDVYQMTSVRNGITGTSILDLRDSTKAIEYYCVGETGQIRKQEIPYGNGMTKATMLAMIKEEFLAYAGKYASHTATDLVKTAGVTPDYLMRTADRYAVYGSNEYFLIDCETNICVEWSDGRSTYSCYMLTSDFGDIEIPEDPGTGTGEEPGTEPGETPDLVSFESEEIDPAAAFDALSVAADGFGVTYYIQQTTPCTVSFAAKDDVYYTAKITAKGEITEQKYVDLRDATKAVIYQRNPGTGKFDKYEIQYSDDGASKATMLNMVKTEFLAVAGTHASHTATDLVKTADVTPQQVKRTADRYAVSGSALYYVVDRETGFCLDWSDGTNGCICMNFVIGIDSIDLPDVGSGTGETGEDPGTGGEGGNTGEDETGTTIIAVYPNITDTTTVDRAFARGAQVTITATEGEENNVYTIVYGEAKNVFYMQSDDGEFYFDLADGDYYVYYEKEDGEWTAVRCYYADEDADFTDRTALTAYLRSSVYPFLILTSQDTANTVMQQSAGTYLRRPVDVFTATANGITYTVVVDQATSLVLSNTMSATVEGVTYSYTTAVTAFETGVACHLPEVDVRDPHEEGGEEGGEESGEEGGDLVAIAEDFDADDVLSYLVAADHGGFSITYEQGAEIVTAAGKGGIYTASNNFKGTTWYDIRDRERGVSYSYFPDEENPENDWWMTDECVYAEREMTQWDFLNNGEFGQAGYMMTAYRYADGAIFTKEATTYTRGDLTRNAWLYQSEEAHEKYIIDAKTGVCLEYQTEWDTYYCTAFELNIADIALPDVPVEPVEE